MESKLWISCLCLCSCGWSSFIPTAGKTILLRDPICQLEEQNKEGALESGNVGNLSSSDASITCRSPGLQWGTLAPHEERPWPRAEGFGAISLAIMLQEPSWRTCFAQNTFPSRKRWDIHIQHLIEYLLNTEYMPPSVLGTGNKMMNEIKITQTYFLYIQYLGLVSI